MLKASIISLGCSRNLVDSEVIVGSLKRRGFKILDAEEGVDICIINTCAFIGPAREESMGSLLEALDLKKKGKIRYLAVCGCLPQLYKSRLQKALKGIDLVLGTSDFHKIDNYIKNLKSGKGHSFDVSPNPSYLYDEDSPRFLLTPGHFAYVKISEGCSNLCSYCIISDLRGVFRSRPVDSILGEVRGLSAGGRLREINLIGQDTTLFGFDIYGRAMLSGLLKRICRLKGGFEWLRILYTHPAHYSDELVSVIRDEEKICKYLDLPIQHINDRILKMMNRHTTKNGIIKLIEKLRKEIPGLALRTSIIVGFPGESEKAFRELLDFVRQTKFERLGAFIYSREKGTKASGLKNQIPEAVKKDRMDELMRLQMEISRRVNLRFIGKEVKVLVDEKLKEGEYLGRTELDAPEVDGNVFVTGRNLKVGDFCKVKITDALEYDLVGEAG